MATLDVQMPLNALPEHSAFDATAVIHPRRRHSYGTTSHKLLRSDDPQYYARLQKIFGSPEALKTIEMPDEPASEMADDNLDNLAKQTLDELFGDDDIECSEPKAKRSTSTSCARPTGSRPSYELHAPHQLDLHAQLFARGGKKGPPALQRRAESDGAAAILKHALSTQAELAAAGLSVSAADGASAAELGWSLASRPPSPQSASASDWLKLLARRKASTPRPSADSTNGEGAGILPPAAKPPQGWTPALKTVVAVLKLRKLHAAKLASTDASYRSMGGSMGGSPNARPGTPPDHLAPGSATDSSRYSGDSPPALGRQPSRTLTASEVATAIPFVEEMSHAAQEQMSATDLSSYGELFDPSSADFDVQAFYEECWIAQAASDPGRNTFLQGAYNEPAAMPMPMGGANGIGAANHSSPMRLPLAANGMPQPLYAVPTPYGYVMVPLQNAEAMMMGAGAAQTMAQQQQPPPQVQQPPLPTPSAPRQQMSPPMSPPLSPPHSMSPPHMSPPPMMAPPAHMMNMMAPNMAPSAAGMPPGTSAGYTQAIGASSAFATQQALAAQAQATYGGMAYPPQQAMSWQAQAAHAAQQQQMWRGGGGGGQQPASPPMQHQHMGPKGLAAMAQEQEGSRLLQSRLHNMRGAELAGAIDELGPHLTSLATNAFGNYLVSSMASLPAAHHAIAAALAGNVTRLMAHPQGSRVVQAALEKLPQPAVLPLVAELEGRVCEVACSTHGSWSVVAAYKASRAPFVLRELSLDVARLSMQQNGSRVVQRVLAEAAAHGGAEDLNVAVEQLLRLGSARLGELADDRFGNYVVQLALRHATPERQASLLTHLLPSLRTLATSKCGSNVAEVLVERASRAQLGALCSAISPGEAEELRAHPYGSYVMAAIDRARA